MASVIGLGTVFYTALALWGPLTIGTQDGLQRAELISGLLSPFVGTVIGYYFGSQAGERQAHRAEQRAEMAEGARATALERVAAAGPKLARSTSEIEQSRRAFTDLSRTIGELLEQAGGEEVTPQ